nr:hypothetical transcript [Hymenolepis microstoma]
MQDQILSSLSPIRGAYLSSSQTRDEKEIILQAIKAGQYAYVLMSPEALVETDWILRTNCLPPISFVCVDEAHCLADWSHHFRPSYLQICNLLRTRLGITRFLGLSATCTPSTIRNICSNLGIGEAIKLDAECNSEEVLSSFEPAGGYLQPISCPIPSNLLVTASMDHNRDEALIKMLQRPPFSEQLSILVYAATRDLTERLAGYIRTCLQDVKEKIGRRTVGWNTAVYHAGLTSKVRDRVQKRFMSGKVRVLVATSAFGMGLNKQDLQAVIHYSLPKSFENYIQEIGRVGRNGQQSYCHTFLPPGFSSQSVDTDEDGAPVITPEESREANELRRHIFANHIDSVQLKRLLNLIAGRRSRVVALDPDQIAEELDIKPESLATLIIYMHLRTDMQPLLSTLPSWPAKVAVSCYGGPRELARISSKCLAMSAWLGHLKSQAIPGTPFPSPTLREVTIDLPLLCNNWGWKPDAVLRELRSFEWDTTGPSGAPRRSGVSVSLVGSTRATWLWVHPFPTDSSLAERLDAEVVYLKHRLGEVERAGLRSLAQLQSAVALVAARCIDDIDFEDENVKSKSDQFHSRVEAHFCETIDEEGVMASWPRPITKEKEIGRVGRNGQQSYCHTFLPPGFSSQSVDTDEDGAPVITPEESREANELRRHIFANHIDSVQLKRLLNLIAGRRSRVVALDPDQIAEELDIKPESLATLIIYMHLRTDMQPLLSTLPSWPAKVAVSCYGGPRELARISSKCLAMSAWLGHLKSQAIPGTPFPSPTLREVTIDLPLLCNNWGWKPDAVLRELRSFEWDTTGPSGAPRRSGVSVSLVGSTRATWLWVHPFPTDSSLAERLDAEVVYLKHRLGEVERAGLRSLAQLQSAVALVAARCIDDIDFEDENVKSKSDQFHSRVEAHFCETIDEEGVMASWPRPITKEKEESVCRTVGEFLRLHGESVKSGQVTGRVMANIFQGIGSPNFPAYSWSRVHRFWRAHLDVDWPQLQRIATRELVAAHAAF